ncbi:hypothetical protein [Butyrivibrio sp. AC2005]|uniref:hypothetical protein n=1 Tax=Butyrivibrio sp. AC2005 TaxID=1280672 RepID=UPI00040EDB51|nr:hypothetical protein [Butyrivibrio sp. AC2005]
MLTKTDLQQEAYKRIEMLSDDDIRLIINLMDKIKPSSPSSNDERKKKIRDMAGKYDFDETAVEELRMGSMI